MNEVYKSPVFEESGVDGTIKSVDFLARPSSSSYHFQELLLHVVFVLLLDILDGELLHLAEHPLIVISY